MHCDCHIHMALDGSDWKAALARHKTAPDETFIRATLKNYQTLGFDFLRDGGDRWGAGEFAAKIAAEYGIRYRTPAADMRRSTSSVRWCARSRSAAGTSSKS